MPNPRFVCVLDFEASCDDIIKFYDSEIIEFPSTLYKLINDTYEYISEFQKYCKPLRKQTLTKFCTELTGITQEQVNNGGCFPLVLKEHNDWLLSYVADDEVLFLTCGNSDLTTFMINECKKWAITPPLVYRKFVNVNAVFSDFYQKPKSGGLKKMLKYLGLEQVGRHHSGIDDCRNLAQVWIELVRQGLILDDRFIQIVDKNEFVIAHPNKKKELEKKKQREDRLEGEVIKFY